MNLINKIQINYEINKEDNKLLENFDDKFVNKYKHDHEKIEYIFEKLVSKDDFSYCSDDDLISLLYVYTNDKFITSKKLDSYNKSIIKKIILEQLVKRAQNKMISSKNLYFILSIIKNEKSVYKQELEKQFIKNGTLKDLNRYYKNKTTKDELLLKEVLKKNPYQCLKIAKKYNNPKRKKILPLELLEDYVLLSNDESLIIDFASNVLNADMKKIEDYIISLKNSSLIYKYLINVQNCDKKRLLNELKNKKEYYYLLLAACNLNHVTNIDFSKLSTDDFFMLLHYLDIPNDKELLLEIYNKYKSSLNDKCNYKDANKIKDNIRSEFIKRI